MNNSPKTTVYDWKTLKYGEKATSFEMAFDNKIFQLRCLFIYIITEKQLDVSDGIVCIQLNLMYIPSTRLQQHS